MRPLSASSSAVMFALSDAGIFIASLGSVAGVLPAAAAAASYVALAFWIAACRARMSATWRLASKLTFVSVVKSACRLNRFAAVFSGTPSRRASCR